MDLTELLNAVDAAVWGPPMIILLLGCHIYTTIRTKCIQRKLPLALKLSVTKDDDAEGDVSNFGAMATSLASTLGTGSIVGVATAVLSGGPGAVLWMWLTGILGMATKYTEVFAAMKYRVKDWRGEMMGGAMHVWEQRYKRADGTVPWWAKLAAIWFALLACFTIFGIGSAVQTSAITSVVQANFGWDPAIVSAFVCGTALLIILGGLQKVSSICEKLVPIMAVIYIVACLIVVIRYANTLPAVFHDIFEGAFTPSGVTGGVVGSMVLVITWGVKRGVFSNEAGLGSAPIAHAATSETDCVKQGLYGIFEVFMDTILICTLSGLTILCAAKGAGLDLHIGTEGNTSLNAAALGTVFSQKGGAIIIAVGLALFAFSTVLGWSLYGTRCCEFLFGHKAIKPYQIVFIIVIFVGATMKLDLAWAIADTLNGLMAIPNLIALVALSGVVVKETKRHFSELPSKK